MNKTLEYNGYSGSIEASTEDGCLHGKILFIEDTITYEAETVPALKAEFNAAVDDYIETCREIGKEPQRPFKGSFNVRIAPDLHRKAVLTAQKESLSLNELASKAINSYVNKTDRPVIIEQHSHHHHHEQPTTNITKYSDTFEATGEEPWTVSPPIMSK